MSNPCRSRVDERDSDQHWVMVRGEDYVAGLDATTFQEKVRIKTPNGRGMPIFLAGWRLSVLVLHARSRCRTSART